MRNKLLKVNTQNREKKLLLKYLPKKKNPEEIIEKRMDMKEHCKKEQQTQK